MVDVTFLVQAFVALFVIVDPISSMPIFLSLMENFRPRERRRMVSRSVFIACLVLLVFTFLGKFIFLFLGISMYSFRIAGGILLLIISIEMLFGKKSRTEMSEPIAASEDDITVTPMAVPLLTGPGAITSGIMLFNSAPSDVERISLLLIILVVFALSYVILQNSNQVYRRLGKTGTKVIMRLMGLMLSAIAVQFMVAGLRDAFPALVSL